MKKLKISIITITYNSEKTIRDTLKSVKNQNYNELEYIIVDGGSTDFTLSICEEYRDIITNIISEPDNGISDAMNKGIRKASGDLIGIIHSDDMLVDNALNVLSKEWDGKTDVYYGDLLVCSQEGKISHMLAAKKDLSKMPYYVEMSHPSTFITKKAYEKYGLYDEQYKCVMDNDLLIRFYSSGALFKYIPTPLAIYRVGGTNMKLRNITIKESRNIALKYGGNVLKSNCIFFKKKIKDMIKQYIRINNRRRVTPYKSV